MNIHVDTAAGRLVLNGRFDFECHRRFREACERVLVATSGPVTIDLANVSYMDSSALGMLLLLRDRADQASRRVALANCQGMVAEVLRVANFDKLFAMH